MKADFIVREVIRDEFAKLLADGYQSAAVSVGLVSAACAQIERRLFEDFDVKTLGQALRARRDGIMNARVRDAVVSGRLTLRELGGEKPPNPFDSKDTE